jgi:hypothetical protein
MRKEKKTYKKNKNISIMEIKGVGKATILSSCLLEYY